MLFILKKGEKTHVYNETHFFMNGFKILYNSLVNFVGFIALQSKTSCLKGFGILSTTVNEMGSDKPPSSFVFIFKFIWNTTLLHSGY